jgi:hypothetical protein
VVAWRLRRRPEDGVGIDNFESGPVHFELVYTYKLLCYSLLFVILFGTLLYHLHFITYTLSPTLYHLHFITYTFITYTSLTSPNHLHFITYTYYGRLVANKLVLSYLHFITLQSSWPTLHHLHFITLNLSLIIHPIHFVNAQICHMPSLKVVATREALTWWSSSSARRRRQTAGTHFRCRKRRRGGVPRPPSRCDVKLSK